MIHWNMTIDHRRTGWLDPSFFSQFCLLHLHAVARYRLACPMYAIMPDHIHLLWIGVTPESDQRLAARFFRDQLNRILKPWRLQKQAFDHVLKERERQRNAFRTVAAYILENPVRAGLVSVAADWPFSGCSVPGYPVLNVHDPDYWSLFWRIHQTITISN